MSHGGIYITCVILCHHDDVLAHNLCMVCHHDDKCVCTVPCVTMVTCVLSFMISLLAFKFHQSDGYMHSGCLITWVPTMPHGTINVCIYMS